MESGHKDHIYTCIMDLGPKFLKKKISGPSGFSAGCDQFFGGWFGGRAEASGLGV